MHHRNPEIHKAYWGPLLNAKEGTGPEDKPKGSNFHIVTKPKSKHAQLRLFAKFVDIQDPDQRKEISEISDWLLHHLEVEHV